MSWWAEALGVDAETLLAPGRPAPTDGQQRAARFAELIEEVVDRGEALGEAIDGGQAEYLKTWAAAETSRADIAAQPAEWEIRAAEIGVDGRAVLEELRS